MASNNFFLSQDPLLFQSQYGDTESNLKKQLNDTMLQYKLLQQRTAAMNGEAGVKDYVSDLDAMLRNSDESTVSRLKENDEFGRLSSELDAIIRNEIISTVKWRINSNPNAVKNIERQLEIVRETSSRIGEEQKKSLNELNDYVRNYSNITFDEYKKIKGKETSTRNNEN